MGDEIEVVVLELDKENRRMSLGHKQIEENPWEVFESVFAVGSKHQATVVKVEGGHATIALPYGLEGTCHSKHLNKQEGGALGVDDQADFVVLEFNRNAKRITVSHLRTYEEGPVKSDLPKKPRSNSGGGGGSSRMMHEVNASVEKSTFGDLSVLTALKEQMDGGAQEEAAAEEPKKRLSRKLPQEEKLPPRRLPQEGRSQEGGSCEGRAQG